MLPPTSVHSPRSTRRTLSSPRRLLRGLILCRRDLLLQRTNLNLSVWLSLRYDVIYSKFIILIYMVYLDTVKSPDLARPLILHTWHSKTDTVYFIKRVIILSIRKNEFALPMKRWFCTWQYYIFAEFPNLMFYGKVWRFPNESPNVTLKITKIKDSKYFGQRRHWKFPGEKVAHATNLPFINKHISGTQDDQTFEHRRKHDGRHLYGCALARFLNISVICLCSYHPAGDVTSFCDAEKGYSENQGWLDKNQCKRAKLPIG